MPRVAMRLCCASDSLPPLLTPFAATRYAMPFRLRRYTLLPPDAACRRAMRLLVFATSPKLPLTIDDVSE